MSRVQFSIKYSSYLCLTNTLTNKSWIRFLIEDWLLLFNFFLRISVNINAGSHQTAWFCYLCTKAATTTTKKEEVWKIYIENGYLIESWMINFFIFHLFSHLLFPFIFFCCPVFIQKCNFLLITKTVEKSTASKDKSTTTLMLKTREWSNKKQRKNQTWTIFL